MSTFIISAIYNSMCTNVSHKAMLFQIMGNSSLRHLLMCFLILILKMQITFYGNVSFYSRLITRMFRLCSVLHIQIKIANQDQIICFIHPYSHIFSSWITLFGESKGCILTDLSGNVRTCKLMCRTWQVYFHPLQTKLLLLTLFGKDYLAKWWCICFTN